MSELVSFPISDDDRSVVVEIDEAEPGYERVSRNGPGVVNKATIAIEGAFDDIRVTAQLLIDKIKTMDTLPSEAEIEFGIRLNAEVGAVIARTQAEGHFLVTVRWSRSSGK